MFWHEVLRARRSIVEVASTSPVTSTNKKNQGQVRKANKTKTLFGRGYPATGARARPVIATRPRTRPTAEVLPGSSLEPQ
jgi:hypothetical protein